MKAAKKPFWAKMTPNVTHITDPSRAALRGGCGSERDQHDPQHHCRESRYLAPRTHRRRIHHAGRLFVKSGATDRAAHGDGNRDDDSREFPGRTLSAIGGIESGGDAAQFILLGADTTQVCTGVMKFGYECVKQMCEELLAFMEKHKFETLADFKGKSLDYFTTHAELVRMQTERERRETEAAADAAAAKKMVRADGEWSGDDFVKQSIRCISQRLMKRQTPNSKLQRSSKIKLQRREGWARCSNTGRTTIALSW